MNRFVLHSWACLFVLVAPCLAQPSEVSYQGELKKDGLPYPGIAQMKFTIVDAEGDSLWSNDGTSVAGAEPASWVDVDATNGIFAVRLGAIPMSPIDGGMLKGVTHAALRVWVDSGEGFEQLTDMPISSSAFALSGEKCLEIGDLQINVVPRWDGAALSPGSIVDDGTNVGIGTTTPAAKLDVAGAIRSSTGGFQFPDGSVQTTAVTGGGSGVPSGAMIVTESPISPEGYSLEERISSGASRWRFFYPLPNHVGMPIAVESMGRVFLLESGSQGSTNVLEFNLQNGNWSGATNRPTGRHEFAAASVDHFIYVMGGNASEFPYTTLATVERFDTQSTTWGQVAPMATPRRSLAAASHGGKLYAVGGISNGTITNELEEYDPLTDTWTTKAPMPTTRRDPGIATVVGRIIVAGGWLSSGQSTAVVEAFDPSANTWEVLPSLTTPRNSTRCAVIGDRLFAIGGWDDLTAYGSSLTDCLEYDFATHQWYELPPMAIGRASFAAIGFGETIYAIGGDPGPNATIEYLRPPLMWYVHKKQ